MFKILLIIFLFFFLLGPIFRFALRTFFVNKVINSQKEYQKPKMRKEGEIRIDNAQPNRPQQTRDDEGQYIDYEEVK